MRRSLIITLTLASVASLVSCSSSSSSEPSEPAIVADLRADSNRDGQVRFDDDSDAQKTTWDATNGAIFLANIDDDASRCPTTGSDVDLPTCNDAADDVINGASDLLDLARIMAKPWPDAPASATASIQLTQGDAALIRLWKRTAPGEDPANFAEYAPGDPLTVADLQSGVELAIEALDIVRDPAVWDGYVVLQLSVTADGQTVTDSVKMRVAPVLTTHHLMPAATVYIANDGYNASTITGLTAACAAAGLPAPTELTVDDQWAQDYFETGYMSMPGAGGAQQVMRVNYRSANVDTPTDAKNPLREAGQLVFTKLRGPDTAGIQQFDITHDQDMDSLNSFGNLETIPPYTLGDQQYPFGRVIRGKTATFYPDPTFVKMVESQGQQPPVYIDTSWLYVGHVDETLSFIKAPSPRGWALVVNDPALAKQMLEDQVTAGNGDVPMFVGESWVDDNGNQTSAQITISGVLADTDVMSTSAQAATESDGQLTVIKAATGLTDAEIVHIPYLHMSTSGKSIAYQPGTVNGVYISNTHFVAPIPHGPQIGGVDIFEKQMTDQLTPFGITVDFIEDWDDYHAVEGEVHCGTNTARTIPDAKWWESAK